MALLVRNTSELIDPTNLKLKILLIAMPGTGKTTWLSTAPNIGVGVTETGHGKGLMSIAANNIDYCELNNYEDMEAFCSGLVFKDKTTLGLDSLSEMGKTIIRSKALSMPGSPASASKRAMGLPDQGDWGVIGELTRKLTRKILEHDKHIICTSGLRIDRPDADNGGETLQGPDFPGQMFLGSSAMFDIVLQMRTRRMLKDPKDAKSAYMQRYLITQGTGGVIAKNRLSVGKGSFLPQEVAFDLETGEGNFEWFLNRAKEAYADHLRGKK